MASKIHVTAVVSKGAELGVDVEIGPYTVIGENVRVGDRTRIGPLVVVEGVTTIGSENQIVGQAALGNAPQDLSYRGEATRLHIGDRNTIREFVTINRGTVKGGGVTSIGSDNLLMACCHVAHDCEVEDHIILGNGVLLAGHSRIEHHANLSGMAGCVAFCTVGAFAYVGGMTRMSRDVPPFMIAEGHDSRVRGVNSVGLQRGGVAEDDIEAIRNAFRFIWRTGRAVNAALRDLRQEGIDNEYVETLVSSMERTEQGLKGRYRESLRAQYTELGLRRIVEGERI